MVDTVALKCEIIRAGLHQTDVAKALKMNPKTFYRRMKKRIFMSDEMQEMVELLKLENPGKIFFAR